MTNLSPLWLTSSRHTWSVEHEIAFLQGLGEWSCCPGTKSALLAGYAIGFLSRVRGFTVEERRQISVALDAAIRDAVAA